MDAPSKKFRWILRAGTAALVGLCALSSSRAVAQEIGVPYVVEGSDHEPKPPTGPAGTTGPGPSGASADPIGEDAGEDEAVAGGGTRGSNLGKSPASLWALWEARRKAMNAGESAAADEKLVALLDAKELSGWPDAFAFASALVRESEKARVEERLSDARRAAEAAVRLAPHSPAARIELAECNLADGNYGGALGDYWSALRLGFSEAPFVRPRLAQLAFALLAALILSGFVFGALLLYRHVFELLHDVRHALPRGMGKLQAALVVASILLAPVLFRLGASTVLLVVLAAVALYLSPRDRFAALVVVAGLGATPLLAPGLLARLGHGGSRAHQLYLAARSLDARDAATALAGRDDLNANEQFVLGLRAMWAGDLEAADRWVKRALAGGDPTPQMLTVAGNLGYLRGDAKTAIDNYGKAIVKDPNHVAAHFNLSRVYYALAEHQQAGESHRRATAIDYERVERLAQIAKRVGPGFVILEELPRQVVVDGALADERATMAARRLWRFLGGPVPAKAFPFLAAICLAVVLAGPSVARRLRVSSRCRRCGLAACRRCNPELPDQGQCGQCYHALVTKAGVEPQLRLQKEIEAHRFAARRRRLRWALSAAWAGAGQVVVGQSISGLALMVAFAFGLFAMALGMGYVPGAPVDAALQPLLVALGAALTLGCYAVGLYRGLRPDHAGGA